MSGCLEEGNNLCPYRESSSGSEVVHLSAQSLHWSTPPTVQPPQTQKLSQHFTVPVNKDHVTNSCHASFSFTRSGLHLWPNVAYHKSCSQFSSLRVTKFRAALQVTPCLLSAVCCHILQNVSNKKHFITRLCTEHVLVQHTHTHTHTHIHTLIHTQTHTDTHWNTHINIHTRTNTHTYIHT